MVTPNGELSIEMETKVSKNSGTVDWIMTMPDGSVEKAFSRISENGNASIYSFYWHHLYLYNNWKEHCQHRKYC